MIEVKLFTCAETVVRDQDSYHVSIINVIENFRSATFPIISPKLACLIWLERESTTVDDTELVLQFTLDDNELHRAPVPVIFQSGSDLVVKIVVNIQNVLIPGPGDFSARLLSGNKPVAEWLMHVHNTGKPDVATEVLDDD